jgi:flagellar assembly factor FliW
MTGSGPAVINPASIPARPETETVETRFGKVTIYPNQPLIFPNGLLGLPDKNQFSLTAMPNEKMARFKLLQSLDDMALSFIVLPVELNNAIAERADIEAAARDLAIPLAQLSLLFIVSVHREGGAIKLSVNARAPLLVDSVKRVATQHVFSNTKYPIRHSLTF